MNVKQLIFFKRTAELGNMTKAAEDLMVSQPFVSRTIAELEKELEVGLFDHVGRRIELNDCGKAFYAHVVRIFNEADDAVREVREIQNNRQTEMSVVTNVGLYLPSLLTMLKTRHPELSVTQFSDKRSNIEKMLIDGNCDFALTAPPLSDNRELETITLFNDEGVLIYPKGHRFEGRHEVDFYETLSEDFISVTQGYGTRECMNVAMSNLNINMKIAVETADTAAIFEYVSRGLGIAFVPFSQVLLNDEFKNRYSFVSAPEYPRGIGMSWRRGKFQTSLDRSVISDTKEHFRRLEMFANESKNAMS